MSHGGRGLFAIAPGPPGDHVTTGGLSHRGTTGTTIRHVKTRRPLRGFHRKAGDLGFSW
jgi:hypothetical protein